MSERYRIVILGLSITSSWGNGHATTYRGLVRELARRKHQVLFLERDAPWYAAARDLPSPPYGRTELYGSVEDLRERFHKEVREADLVVVGSYVPDGIEVGKWVCSTARKGVTAFYDIDTPVTLSSLSAGTCTYLDATLIPRFDLYLSFTGGPTLGRLERQYGARRARPLYCSFDPAVYQPQRCAIAWDLGYMGTFCPTRQPALERLLLAPARSAPERRFVVAGPEYPTDTQWPGNVERVNNVAAREHRAFYTAQRFTLNLTRADMIRAGYSPSVRLFEAAACAVPIISDYWQGLDSFFKLGTELLVSDSARKTSRILADVPERERLAIGRRARRRVLAEHTAEHRAVQVEEYLSEVTTRPRRRSNRAAERNTTVNLNSAAAPE